MDGSSSGAPKAPCRPQVVAFLVGLSTNMSSRILSREPCADNDDTYDEGDDDGENDDDAYDGTEDGDDTDDIDGDEAAADAGTRADKADYQGAEGGKAGRAPAAQKLPRAKHYYDYAGAYFRSHPGSGLILRCAHIANACGLGEQTRATWEPMIRKRCRMIRKQSIRRLEEYARCKKRPAYVAAQVLMRGFPSKPLAQVPKEVAAAWKRQVKPDEIATAEQAAKEFAREHPGAEADAGKGKGGGDEPEAEAGKEAKASNKDGKSRTKAIYDFL